MHDTTITRSAAAEPARSKHTAPTVETHEPAETEQAYEEQATHKRSGLCTTCIYADNCTFCFQPDRQVLQCEEFEGAQCTVAVREFAPNDTTPDVQSDAEVASRYKGLCRTCAHRDECTFSKPEGGVWHCEEFE